MNKQGIQEYLLENQIKTDYSRNLSQSKIVFKRVRKENQNPLQDSESELLDQIQMIQENEISSLLDFSVHIIDDEENIDYEISQMISLNEMFQRSPGKYMEITSLFQGLVKLLYELETHLLDIRHILFDFQYIYWDNGSKEFKFIFYPYFSRNPQGSIRNMANILLKSIDYKDEKVVAFVYEFHRYTQIENFCISETFFHFYKKRENVYFSFQKPEMTTIESQMGVKNLTPEKKREKRRNSMGVVDEEEEYVDKSNLFRNQSGKEKKKIFLSKALEGLKDLLG